MAALLRTRRARVLIVNPSPVRGGAERLLADLCARFERIDAEVVSLASGPFPAELDAMAVPHSVIEAGRLRHGWAWARTVRRLARIARGKDLVLSWQVKGHYYGTPAARMARVPAAWWDHGIRPARRERRWLVDARLPATVPADLIVCSSRAAAARHRRAVTVHPGIDLAPYGAGDRRSARASLGLHGTEPIAGIVGRLQPWKGQDVFLRAATRVAGRHPTARFCVIGGAVGGFDEDYPAALRSLARRLGIEDRVIFTGHRDDVPALLPALDVSVLASFDEPFGIAVIESMAAGVPVVATSAGGVPEIVTDGLDGVLVPAGDEARLASEVVRLFSDPARAGSIAGAARATVRERFTIERCVRDLEDAVLGTVNA